MKKLLLSIYKWFESFFTFNFEDSENNSDFINYLGEEIDTFRTENFLLPYKRSEELCKLAQYIAKQSFNNSRPIEELSALKFKYYMHKNKINFENLYVMTFEAESVDHIVLYCKARQGYRSVLLNGFANLYGIGKFKNYTTVVVAE